MEIGHVDVGRRLDLVLASALIAGLDPELLTSLAAPPLASQDWFPGRDYPDREVWLAKRNTPRGVVHGKLIYAHPADPKAKSSPLALGINRAKREAARVDKLTRRADVDMFAILGNEIGAAKRPMQHHKIMKARAEYRAARYEANRNG